jgi:hypothetical protein
MAEEAHGSSGASSFSSGFSLSSGSTSNVSTPLAPSQPRLSTSSFERELTMVSPLDEAVMLTSAVLESPSVPWPSISPESTAIAGGSMRLSPVANSAQSEPDGRRALFPPDGRPSEPTSTASSSEPLSHLNVNPGEQADNGRRNTSVNRRRRLGLRAWCSAHWDHPYPDADEKHELCREFSMSRRQLDIW